MIKPRARVFEPIHSRIPNVGYDATLPDNCSGIGDIVRPAGADLSVGMSHWPPQVQAECELIFLAMVPRRLVAVYVADQDYQGVPIPARELAEGLRRRISRATGGQTKYRHGEGDYCPPGRPALAEQTLTIETFLPLALNDDLRLELIRFFVEFGKLARQDVVQVQVAFDGYWIPTKLFREIKGTVPNSNGRDVLNAG